MGFATLAVVLATLKMHGVVLSDEANKLIRNHYAVSSFSDTGAAEVR